MSVIAALLLAASPCAAAPGEPMASAHASGMHAVSMQTGSGQGAQGARRSHFHSSDQPCDSRFESRSRHESRVRRRAEPQGARHDAAARAGDPVRLGPAFFQTGDAGGVGRDPAVYTVSRRLIVIGPGHPPPSAGREAARRGLGRK